MRTWSAYGPKGDQAVGPDCGAAATLVIVGDGSAMRNVRLSMSTRVGICRFNILRSGIPLVCLFKIILGQGGSGYPREDGGSLGATLAQAAADAFSSETERLPLSPRLQRLHRRAGTHTVMSLHLEWL